MYRRRVSGMPLLTTAAEKLSHPLVPHLSSVFTVNRVKDVQAR